MTCVPCTYTVLHQGGSYGFRIDGARPTKALKAWPYIVGAEPNVSVVLDTSLLYTMHYAVCRTLHIRDSVDKQVCNFN